MQYAWAIASVVVLLAGSCAAGMAVQRSGMGWRLGRNIQIGTTAAIFAVLLHNLYWEREINEMASKGWTLLYTAPAFLISVLISGVLAIVFAVRSRRLRGQAVDQPPTAEDRPVD